jgi:hypothetical protein
MTIPSIYILASQYSIIMKGKAVPRHIYGGAGGEELQFLLIHDLGIRWG